MGLRVGELAAITRGNYDGEFLTFYRAKVNLTQTHRVPVATKAALDTYTAAAPEEEPAAPLLCAIRKNGAPAACGMSTTAIAKRVTELGKAIGIENLSPHDLRHYWATQAARNGTSLNALMQAGGWSSPAMPMRYIETAKIANQGVII